MPDTLPDHIFDAQELLRAPVADVSPFVVFGLDVNATLSEADLKESYLQLVRLVHPDRFGGKDAEQQVRARDWSALVNRSYRVLKEPKERLEWLLRSEGLLADKNNGAGSPPQELLMEAIELNELLEEAGTGELGDATRSHLQEQSKAIDERLKDFEETVASLLKDVSESDRAKADIADEYCSALNSHRYLLRLRERLRSCLES